MDNKGNTSKAFATFLLSTFSWFSEHFQLNCFCLNDNKSNWIFQYNVLGNLIKNLTKLSKFMTKSPSILKTFDIMSTTMSGNIILWCIFYTNAFLSCTSTDNVYVETFTFFFFVRLVFSMINGATYSNETDVKLSASKGKCFKEAFLKHPIYYTCLKLL